MNEELLKAIGSIKSDRIKKGITLERLENATKIAKRHLLAIEFANFDALPHGAVYKKSIIMRYAEAVGAPVKILESLSAALDVLFKNDTVSVEESQLKQRAEKKYLINLPRILGRGAVAVVALVAIIYISFEIRNVLRPPELVVFNPYDGQVTEDTTVIVEGRAQKEARIAINGKSVYSNEDGTFRLDVALDSGLNVIRVTAVRKYGRKAEVVRQVIARRKIGKNIN